MGAPSPGMPITALAVTRTMAPKLIAMEWIEVATIAAISFAVIPITRTMVRKLIATKWIEVTTIAIGLIATTPIAAISCAGIPIEGAGTIVTGLKQAVGV